MMAGHVYVTNFVLCVWQRVKAAGGGVHARGRVLLGVGAQRRGRPALPARQGHRACHHQLPPRHTR